MTSFCGTALDAAAGDALPPLHKPFDQSTAILFKSADGKDTVKIYRPSDAGLAEFEYYALLFLKEKGKKVSSVIRPPTHDVEPDKATRNVLRQKGFPVNDVSVIVKKFVPGRGYFDRNARWTDEQKQEVIRARDEMRSLFANGEFRAWLGEKGVDPAEKKMPPSMVDRSDIDFKDFVHTDEGWVLVDP